MDLNSNEHCQNIRTSPTKKLTEIIRVLGVAFS